MLLMIVDIQAQNTRMANSQLYSKDLKEARSELMKLKTNNHKDKKETGMVDKFREVAKLHPEEEGVCNMYIADFYMFRSNYPNYDSSIFYHMKALGNIPDSMPFERYVVYSNLAGYYISQEDFDNAVRYASLMASIDTIYIPTLARLTFFGGPEYFDPILTIDYCQAAMRMGVAEDLFPLIYAAQYVINAIDSNTFDSVAFEYYRKAYCKINSMKTLEESALYHEKAAERNFFPAVTDLATHITNRKLYADKDQKEMCKRAVSLLEPLIAANYAPAAHAAGAATEYANLILGGILVSPKGFREAYPYFKKGCDLGYPPSIAEMGRYYELNQGGLFGLQPDVAIQYYNAAEKEGYYQATVLKKQMAVRLELQAAKMDIIYSTISLVEQSKQTKELFKSREFEKKYNKQSIHKAKSGGSNVAENRKWNQRESDANSKVERKCRLCMGSGKCCGYGDMATGLHNYYCKGSGKCGECHGEGIVKNPLVPSGPGSYIQCSLCNGLKRCHYCGGTGVCSRCNGTGKQ